MALEQKLHLKLSQKLIMTPSLQQAIKLLQLSKLELQEVLNQELLENPLLDEVGEETKQEEAETEAEQADGKTAPDLRWNAQALALRVARVSEVLEQV